MNRVRGIASAATIFLGAGLWAIAVPARAQGDDDRAAAVALVRQLELDPAHHALTAESLALAKEALERATRMRGAGDEVHARTADAVAKEWAQTARDLAIAAEAEEKAAELRRKALAAQAQLERARALVEEGITHLGRLRAELEAAGKTVKEDHVAVEVHEGDPRPKKDIGKKDTTKKPDHGASDNVGGAP